MKKKTCISRAWHALPLLIAAFLLFGCASSGVQERTDADYHNKMGIANLNEGKIQPAFIEFQKALKADPDNKQALYNLGIVHYQLEEYDKARDYFARVVKIDPQYADAHNNLGNAYLQLGQREAALESFKKALANPLYTTPEKAYYSMGLVYYRLGDFAKALNAYKDAIKRDRSFILPYYGMALTLNKMGNYGDAAEIMDKAIEVDQNYRGDREKKRADLKEQLITAKGEEEEDLQDLLEIMNY